MSRKYFRVAESSVPPDFARRRFLAAAASLPLLLCLPGRVEAGSIIHRIVGEVFVNNRKATPATAIRPGDNVVVSHGGQLAMSVGGDAFLLHGGTVLEIAGRGTVSGLRLVTGALLSVFAKRRKSAYISTGVATIGIRGTGVFLKTSPHRLYTCTCYGHTDLRYGNHLEQVHASHHVAHEIALDEAGAMAMKSMEVLDHTDDELRMLEAFVGRKPLFDM